MGSEKRLYKGSFAQGVIINDQFLIFRQLKGVDFSRVFENCLNENFKFLIHGQENI